MRLGRVLKKVFHRRAPSFGGDADHDGAAVAREDLEAAYETPAGVAAVGLGLALQGASYLWIRSLLRVEA